jgi:hypothetical protein
MRTSSPIALGPGILDFERKYSIEKLVSSFLKKNRNGNEMKDSIVKLRLYQACYKNLELNYEMKYRDGQSGKGRSNLKNSLDSTEESLLTSKAASKIVPNSPFLR